MGWPFLFWGVDEVARLRHFVSVGTWIRDRATRSGRIEASGCEAETSQLGNADEGLQTKNV